MAGQYRRTDPRYQRRVDVEVLMEGKWETAVSRNISLGGLFAETPQLVPPGTLVQVRFKVPTQPEPIEVTGNVCWVESDEGAGPAGLGIRFHGLRARDVWALNRFFQHTAGQ